MDIAFCKTNECGFCNEMKQREYLESTEPAKKRLDDIMERYKNRTIVHAKPLNWDDTDYEYQVLKDTSLSLGAI